MVETISLSKPMYEHWRTTSLIAHCSHLKSKTLYYILLKKIQHYHLWKQLFDVGTGSHQIVPGTTSRYPVLPDIPGTYLAQHWQCVPFRTVRTVTGHRDQIG